MQYLFMFEIAKGEVKSFCDTEFSRVTPSRAFMKKI